METAAKSLVPGTCLVAQSIPLRHEWRVWESAPQITAATISRRTEGIVEMICSQPRGSRGTRFPPYQPDQVLMLPPGF